MKVYYLVYRLTNVVNDKVYVGCHMTKDVNDSYMGSGKRLGYAKRKYGLAAFRKEILSVHETPEEMLAAEALIVTQEFLKRPDVYNLTCGGKGSWFWVNQQLTPEQRTKAGKAGGYANRTFEQRSIAGKIGGIKTSKSDKFWNKRVKRGEVPNYWLGKNLTDEHKLKISKVNKGKAATPGMRGKNHTEATKQKIREKRALQPKRIGWKHSEETKRKIKESLLSRK